MSFKKSFYCLQNTVIHTLLNGEGSNRLDCYVQRPQVSTHHHSYHHHHHTIPHHTRHQGITRKELYSGLFEPLPVVGVDGVRENSILKD